MNKNKGEQRLVRITGEDYNIFRKFLEDSCGIVLGANKLYLVTNRLTNLMLENNINSIIDLIEILKESNQAKLREQVIDAMTTNETNWFRDKHPFDILSNNILPEFKNNSRLKIWSAACSSGQEPYSISICVSEFLRKNLGYYKNGVEILATDISYKMIERAKLAQFDLTEMQRGMSPERLDRYFISSDNNCKEPIAEIKNRVVFRQYNLLNSYILLGKFDVIFCRNVMIYFSNDIKDDLANRMADALNTGGYLILGAPESISDKIKRFAMVNFAPGIAYRKIK